MIGLVGFEPAKNCAVQQQDVRVRTIGTPFILIQLLLKQNIFKSIRTAKGIERKSLN